MIFDLIVIGGGPGGIFTGLEASSKGLKVALLEKNKRIGNKILVAGSGKCNLTHEGKIKDFLSKYGENGKFLKEALNKFSSEHLKDFFEKKGLPLVLVEESGKFFPKTFSSLDVVNLLKDELEKNKVEIYNNCEILEIYKEEENFIIKTNIKNYKCERLMIATGGMSYPGTGTTGDGYHFAKKLGHKIVPPQPALAPIFIKDYKFTELSGVSFPNVKISFWKDDKKIIEKRGPVLFTHTNLSGPGILDNSRYVEKNSEIVINYIDEDFQDAQKLFIESVNINGKITVKKYFSKYNLPERFIKLILDILDIKENLKIAELEKGKRDEVLKYLCDYKMQVSRVAGFENAMVTKGGVCIKEINSKTMESKLVKNLYFSGEILDIDGDTGGYNIQGACSMGVLAGRSMKK